MATLTRLTPLVIVRISVGYTPSALALSFEWSRQLAFGFWL